MFLLIFFLLACGVGVIAAWRVRPPEVNSFAAIVLILCSAILSGALTVAAEAGSASARYLGLAALLLGSAAFSSAVMVAIRRAAPTQTRP